MLLQVTAELGVPALIAFLAVLITAWRALARLRQNRSADSGGRALSGALGASLFGFCVCGMFLHTAFFPVLPLLLGFTVALTDICAAPAYAQRAQRGGLVAFVQAARGAAV
jgi:O-antigen ligase